MSKSFTQNHGFNIFQIKIPTSFVEELYVDPNKKKIIKFIGKALQQK
jgi:predicted signal transduction protein with EAL and GGDEF domain